MPCTLLVGQDDWSKKQYVEKVKNEVLGNTTDLMNAYEAKDKAINLAQLQDIIDTLPFFTTSKFIYLKDTGYFKSGKKDESEQFRQLLINLPDYVIMLIDEKEVDKKLKVYKEVKENHHIIEFNYLSEEQIIKCLEEKRKKINIKIDKATLVYFVQHMPEDMHTILEEWEKIINYAEDQPITKTLIDKICIFPLETRVFELIKKITNHQNDEALKIYHDMIQSKESPFVILTLMARQFRMMYQIKSLVVVGHDTRQIASQMKMPYFAVREAVDQVRHYSFKQLEMLIQEALETDRSIKTGQMEMVQGVELLIIKTLTF